jgi:hypothetical protein
VRASTDPMSSTGGAQGASDRPKRARAGQRAPRLDEDAGASARGGVREGTQPKKSRSVVAAVMHDPSLLKHTVVGTGCPGRCRVQRQCRAFRVHDDACCSHSSSQTRPSTNSCRKWLPRLSSVSCCKLLALHISFAGMNWISIRFTGSLCLKPFLN